jgi:hypothetical protein
MAWVIKQDRCFKPVPLYPSAQLQSVRDELKDFVAKLYRHEEEVSVPRLVFKRVSIPNTF